MKRLVQIPLKSCSYPIVPEQKARTTYDNLLRLIDDPDVREPLKFLREREVVHFQRFGDALRVVQDNLDAKNYYAYNPSIDIRPKETLLECAYAYPKLLGLQPYGQGSALPVGASGKW